MTHVAVRNGNLDGALRKFKQKVARNGIPSEFKKEKHMISQELKDVKLKKLVLKMLVNVKKIIETNLEINLN